MARVQRYVNARFFSLVSVYTHERSLVSTAGDSILNSQCDNLCAIAGWYIGTQYKTAIQEWFVSQHVFTRGPSHHPSPLRGGTKSRQPSSSQTLPARKDAVRSPTALTGTSRNAAVTRCWGNDNSDWNEEERYFRSVPIVARDRTAMSYDKVYH